MRTPPSWFVRELKRINRHFSVRWHPSKGAWSIDEGVRWSVYRGLREGAPVYTIGRRPLRGLYFSDLGSGVLDMIKRADPRRFRTVEDLVEGLGIDR